ncbi:isoprenyl transferase [Mycoplasma sp. CAG:877]|nr:isoprenyl transferase [Mycoplasma sp. CAG:877]
MKDDLIIPNHVGIIMDGNGRWAQKRGLARSLGHKAGADNLLSLCKHISKVGVKYLSLYAFSTENFKREAGEVNYLMNLFIELFNSKLKELSDNNVKVIFSGRREPLPEKVLKAMDEVVTYSENNTGLILNICINYGGRAEIVDMTKKLCELYKDNEITLEDIDYDLVNKNLYHELPDVDLVIRTSGELRISNFMLYQSSYAEYYFPETLFPDFNEEEFDKAILEFNKRNRRFGGQ